MDKLKDWVVSVISGLVSKPENVEVNAAEDEKGILFTVKVDPEDVGKIIGSKGAIAEALRTIIRSAGYVENMRASMRIDASGAKSAK